MSYIAISTPCDIEKAGHLMVVSVKYQMHPKLDVEHAEIYY